MSLHGPEITSDKSPEEQPSAIDDFSNELTSHFRKIFQVKAMAATRDTTPAPPPDIPVKPDDNDTLYC